MSSNVEFKFIYLYTHLKLRIEMHCIGSFSNQPIGGDCSNTPKKIAVHVSDPPKTLVHLENPPRTLKTISKNPNNRFIPT